MYSNNISSKVGIMFHDLKRKILGMVVDKPISESEIDMIYSYVASETGMRSQTILNDMLYELNNNLLKTEFFDEVAKRNKFRAMNLNREIMDKYKFNIEYNIEYKQPPMLLQAVKVGGTTLALGGACEIGVVLISGLTMSSLMPIPIGVLFAVALGVAIVDYLVIGPKRDAKALNQALDRYFADAEQQFLNWFDEIEIYFYQRVEEIKQTL